MHGLHGSAKRWIFGPAVRERDRPASRGRRGIRNRAIRVSVCPESFRPTNMPVRTLRRASWIFRFNDRIQIWSAKGEDCTSCAPFGGAGRPPACVPAPSPGGCRLRSHGGSQWPDGFPDPSGVSMGCGLLWFSGQLSDECGPGHQIECGIFQYWDVGGRHMAPKHQFGARGQCPGRRGQQLNGVESGRHRKLPQTH